MTNEKEWWDDGIVNIVDDLSSNDLARLKEAIGKIVAEAERLGEVKAWEEAQKMVLGILVRYTGKAGLSDYEFITRGEVVKAFEAKLTELKK